MNSIWIVPASDGPATENLPRSLAEGFASDIKASAINKGFDSDYAWGAKLGSGKNKTFHNQMQKGDLCLFYTADQQSPDEKKKAYRWLAKIEDKTDDPELAEAIWKPGKSGENFSLIYFLTKPLKIYLETDQLSALLTTNNSAYYDAPKGLAPIKRNEVIEYIGDQYGSFDGFANHIAKNYALESPDEEIYPQFYNASSSLEPSTNNYTITNDLLKAIFKEGTNERKAAYSTRRSSESKKIGDEAELFVYNLLKDGKIDLVKTETVKNVASEKVGWDIQYENESGDLVKVEVKGTVGKQFLNFEITQNELEKLSDPANLYHIYLVAGCRNDNKKIQIIYNIRDLISTGQVTCTPLTHRLELIGS
ncbi:DUF3883 domain-containing protein [Vreelandella sp. H-I2]